MTKVKVKVKVDVKLSLCLIKHHAMKVYWRSRSIAPRILDLGTRRRWVRLQVYKTIFLSFVLNGYQTWSLTFRK